MKDEEKRVTKATKATLWRQRIVMEEVRGVASSRVPGASEALRDAVIVG